MNNTRLPALPVSTDTGLIYVCKLNNVYKIGFTRRGLARRVRDSGGELVLTIPTGQRPSVLEYAINRRFAAKRLPSQGEKAGDKREWFALDNDDLAWLRGLASYLA